MANEGEYSPPDRVPYRLNHDFETGELYGWEPYPYQQDIGYDALYFTRQSPTHNDSRYALARPVRANHTTELYHGFTRRLNLWTTSQTHIRAAVYFQADRNPEALELTLGTFDGRRYRHRISKPKANEWVELEIPAEAFRLDGQPLTAGEHIQVITMKASYPVVYHSYSYTILLDDFEINGERQRRFRAEKPSSTVLEAFDHSVLNRHYYYGDTIALQVSPEQGAPLESVSGELIDADGQVVKEEIPFDSRGGQWVNENVHQLVETDARGQWKLRLNGRTKEGSEVHWDFRFLMPGEPVRDHPRLFFSREELDERLADPDPVREKILENTLSNTAFMEVDLSTIHEEVDRTSEALTGGPYAKHAQSYGKWRTPMIILTDVIREGSFYYAFTGDEAAGRQAKEALLKLSSFEKWNNDWMLGNQFWTYYPVGYTLKFVAYGYDMLNDLLSEEEKARVRTAIIEKGLKLFHRDMVEMNRMPSNLTNHLAVITTGHALAATAIYGDDPENPWLEPWLSGIIAKASAFIDRTYYEDGSYAEPYTYQAMGTRSLVEMFAAFERNFGLDWSTTTHVRHFYKYPMMATHTDQVFEHPGSLVYDLEASHTSGVMPDYGDAGRTYDGFTQAHSWWFIHRLGNPYLYQYVKPYWEDGNGGYFSYLWYRDDIDPESRESWPTSKEFEADGMVMRSGWEDESTVITTRVGPNSNHYHYDQGSFQVMTHGEMLLDDPGVGPGGYYANLLFRVYNIHSIAHNVMLVDHDPESQTPADYDNGIKALQNWPVRNHTFTGELADAIESELAVVYKDKLDSYTRTLLYTKTGPLFLFDQVRAKSPDGHTYDWLFHASHNNQGRSMQYENGRMSVEQENARLTLDVLSPEIAEAEIRDAVGAARGGARFEENFLTLSSKPGLTEVDFLAVLLPEARPAAGEYAPRPLTTRVEAPGWVGARVEQEDAVHLGMFRISDAGSSAGSAATNAAITDADAGPESSSAEKRRVSRPAPEDFSTVEGFATDATRFTASFDREGELQRVYFEGRTLQGHGFKVQSESAITCAMALEGSRPDRMEVKSERAAELVLSAGERPLQVRVNGERSDSWNYNAGSDILTLQIPKGRSNIHFQ